MVFRTNFAASTGICFHPVGQGERTSTRENPFPSTWFWIALRIARRVAMSCFASPRATRSR